VLGVNDFAARFVRRAVRHHHTAGCVQIGRRVFEQAVRPPVGPRVSRSFLPHLFSSPHYRPGVQPVHNSGHLFCSTAARQTGSRERAAGHSLPIPAKERFSASHAHQGPVGNSGAVLCALVYCGAGPVKTYLSIKSVAVAVAAGAAVGVFLVTGVGNAGARPVVGHRIHQVSDEAVSSGRKPGHGRPVLVPFRGAPVRVLSGFVSWGYGFSFIPGRGDAEDRKRSPGGMVVLFWVVLVALFHIKDEDGAVFLAVLFSITFWQPITCTR